MWYLTLRYKPLAFFLFLYFLKTFFYRNIFLVSQFTVLYPYRPSAGRPAPCRPPAGGGDLYVIKILSAIAWRPLPPGGGAVGRPIAP